VRRADRPSSRFLPANKQHVTRALLFAQHEIKNTGLTQEITGTGKTQTYNNQPI